MPSTIWNTPLKAAALAWSRRDRGVHCGAVGIFPFLILAGIVMAMPDVDETRVGATGGSQGGGIVDPVPDHDDGALGRRPFDDAQLLLRRRAALSVFRRNAEALREGGPAWLITEARGYLAWRKLRRRRRA